MQRMVMETQVRWLDEITKDLKIIGLYNRESAI